MEQKLNQENERSKEGSMVTIYIMFGNLLISTVFLIFGIIGKSMAVLTTGIDSLSDAASSLLVLLGFKISSRKPDYLHPNGHKRIEYIIGLLISEIILYVAFTLGKKSIGFLLHPTVAPVSLYLLAITLFGAMGKLLIGIYINQKNKALHSTSLKAYYKNTMADLKGICFVAASSLIQQFTTLPVDTIAGLLLSFMIGMDGLKSFFENVSLLIGEGNDILGRNSYANQ